jgi:hypothetical protein
MELMELRMELPDDVLCLIREYAKPWFKYHARYKRFLVSMGLSSFPELRHCLHTHPEQILPTLVYFEMANLALDDSNSDEIEYNRTILCDAQRDVHRRVQMLCGNLKIDFE